jgi:hypothetical protein
MHNIEIEKIRRFSLIIALIILTYSIAGISLAPNTNIFIIGLSFKISRPDWLLIGLVIASFCTMIRFYYYGFMLKKSPYRIRRDIIDNLQCYQSSLSGKKVRTYFGTTKFLASLSISEQEEAKKYIDNFPEIFPKFARARPSMRIKVDELIDEREEFVNIIYDVVITIPVRCRLAALFQDIDYSSPIWLNLSSLAIFFYQIGLSEIYI